MFMYGLISAWHQWRAEGDARANAHPRRAGVLAVLFLLGTLALALILPARAFATASDDPQLNYVFHFTYSTVWVNDQTHGLWPIRDVVKSWDKGTNVSVRYGACRPNAGCVQVSSEAVAEPFNWAGTTWANEDLLTHEIHGTDTVTLNDTWGQSVTLHDRTAVACHEIGHALGLMYHWPDASTGSCIVAVFDPNQSDTPNAQDRAYLNDVYPKPASSPRVNARWRCASRVRHGAFAGECRL